MKDFLTRLSKARFPYEPLIVVHISRRRIIHNLNEFGKLAPNRKIAPVLKSNSYGHGLIEIARILEHEKNQRDMTSVAASIPFMVVDSYFEAIALRSNGIRTPILVIGYTPPSTIARARLKDTSFTITSLEALRQLSELEMPHWSEYFCQGKVSFLTSLFPKRHKIHIKIDTGMRRQGILPHEVTQAIEIIQKDELLQLEGICSHLSDADNIDSSFTESQVTVWNRVTKQFRSAFPHLKYLHLSNTDGHRFTTDIDANVSRLGIGMYGLINGSSFQPELDLQPVMEMKTILTSTKKLEIGETVGYSNTFAADRNMMVATIPVGYYEGLDRRLSNRGTVLVGPERIPCPIIGRVSMNIASIDISHVANPEIGMEVIVISNYKNDPNSLENIATLCGTIAHESAVKIPAHLKRVVVE